MFSAIKVLKKKPQVKSETILADHIVLRGVTEGDKQVDHFAFCDTLKTDYLEIYGFSSLSYACLYG